MIWVDPRNPKPLYEQIKESVRGQMLRGVLQPHDQLPSVRQLAQQAAINPNTIQKAYRDLESEGLLYSVPGKGCFVAQPLQDVRNARIEEIFQTINPLLAELKSLGLGGQAILERVKGRVMTDD